MEDGHPYLVRKALYEIARYRQAVATRSHLTLEQLIKIAPPEEGLYSEHLCRHLFNLNKDDGELETAMKKVVTSKNLV